MSDLTTLLAADVNTGETVTFWICAILAVIGAVGLVASRKAVHSALFVAMTMISLAILYVANSAPFLGMVQVIVYTGAVMMLFLFVLMIVGVDSSDSLVETIRGQRWAAIAFGLGLGVMLLAAIGNGMVGVPEGSLDAANSAQGGNVQGLAQVIFTDYLFAFELTSALLITAAMGAMILAHRERWMPRASQEQQSVERFRSGGHPGNKPNPGVYARHNAVDTPALLPDGSTADISVPEPLQVRGDGRGIDRAALREVDRLETGEAAVAPGTVATDEEVGSADDRPSDDSKGAGA
ncbi:MAG: NADH-quinone oxidoreductase subunit J [Candidatus Nanopelagicales bacterium]